jgi:hypothetical protein
MISSGYVSLTAFKVRAGLAAGGAHDDEAERAVEAASRAIDRFCNRRFTVDTVASVRTYTAEDCSLLPVDDISTTTSLVVVSDDNWDATFETAWTLNNRTSWGFMVEPANWSPLGLPITRLRAVAGSWPTVPQGIQVTALWGWASIPRDIEEACLLLASRLWKRKDLAFGVMGTQETGFISLPKVDPDVQALLAPFRRMSTP